MTESCTAMSILVLIQASTGITWYNINTQLIYLGIQVGINVIYTILVTKRLLAMRSEIRRIMGEYSTVYSTVVLMIIESTMLYTPLAILFIFAFAFHSNISNLCFLATSHVQVSRQKLELSASLMFFSFFSLGYCPVTYHCPCSKGPVNHPRVVIRTCWCTFNCSILWDYIEQNRGNQVRANNRA